MGESAKALLQFALICCCILSLIGWVLYPDPGGIALGVIALLAAALCIVILIRRARVSNKAPDLLGQITKTYLECDGLCFAPAFQVANGRCCVHLFYQNRFSQNCRSEITLTPPVRSFWYRRTGMEPLTVVVDCGGGEYGVVRQFYPITAVSQGRSVTFEIAGKTTYPNGRGDLIRGRAGLRVGQRESTASAILRCLALFAGIISIRSAAKLTCRLPTGVAEEIPESPPPETEVLWSFSTGFPVIVDTPAAQAPAAPTAKA